jgi:hypothetical protein
LFLGFDKYKGYFLIKVFKYFYFYQQKRKEERGKRKEERGKRKEERGKMYNKTKISWKTEDSSQEERK